ncbi:MAG: hypothetical protein IJY01_00480 [Clostridia bacterium]|nr:hypothetical protein [Clostridia bacterium]
MIRRNDFCNYAGKKVKLIDIDDVIFEGILDMSYDYDTDTDYIVIIQESIAIQFTEKEVKSIEIIE